MHLGRVIGDLTSVVKYKEITGEKFLIVEPLDYSLQIKGTPTVALDTVHAGVGDIIFYVVGREATFALDFFNVPIDATIVGIVDDVNPELLIDLVEPK